MNKDGRLGDAPDSSSPFPTIPTMPRIRPVDEELAGWLFLILAAAGIVGGIGYGVAVSLARLDYGAALLEAVFLVALVVNMKPRPIP